MEMNLPSTIQILTRVEIYNRGNVLTLFYEGTPDAMYKYPGAVFGMSVKRVRNALNAGDAVLYPNKLNIPKTF